MIGRGATLLARLTLAPLLVRAGVLAAGLAGLLLAAPPPLWAAPPVLLGVLLLAALPAIVPHGPWPMLVILVTAAGWLVATEHYRQAVDLPRVLLLAAALYLLHALATLAAALPYDARVAPDLVPRWLLRALAVVALSALLSAGVLAGLATATDRAGNRVHVFATLAGLVLAVGLAALLRRAYSGRS